MVKLSPLRFYVEITFNFEITCKSGRPNLISVSFLNFALFFIEYEENHRFWASPPRKIYKIHSIFSKLAHINTNNKLGLFLRFQP
jgi:hypothetical protein